MNKVEFEDFQDRLKGHHKLGVNNECTSDPIYLVQKQVIDWGYEEEYAELHTLHGSCDDVYYDTVQEYFEGYLQEDKDFFTEQTGRTAGEILTLEDLCDVINNTELWKYNGYQVLHGNSRYETVNIFLTYDAAKAWLDSKGEGGTGRIYVDSLYRSSEFSSLIDLVINGKLEYKE